MLPCPCLSGELYSCIAILNAKQKIKQDDIKSVQFFAILWTVTCQAPLSMEFSRQEY